MKIVKTTLLSSFGALALLSSPAALAALPGSFAAQVAAQQQPTRTNPADVRRGAVNFQLGRISALATGPKLSPHELVALGKDFKELVGSSQIEIVENPTKDSRATVQQPPDFVYGMVNAVTAAIQGDTVKGKGNRQVGLALIQIGLAHWETTVAGGPQAGVNRIALLASAEARVEDVNSILKDKRNRAPIDAPIAAVRYFDVAPVRPSK